LASLEKRAILVALAYAKGNKTHAAARLGITRTQLRTRLNRFGLTSEATD
jgi:DNA-binding protein Fis